jgi:aquaporin Z
MTPHKAIPYTLRHLMSLPDENLQTNRLRKKLAAEFVGTFALVFAGTGAIIINDLTGGTITHVGVAITFGLIVLTMVYTLGDVSGAHLNPAVTYGFFVARQFKGKNVLPYVCSQLLGAMAASLCLKLLFAQHQTLGATRPSGPVIQSFVMEVVLSWILMFVILSVSTGAKEKGLTAGIAVGSTVALAALLGGPVSGASMNPARSLAPALLSANLESLWIYLTAPLIGAALAAPACRAVQPNGCCQTAGSTNTCE